MNLRDYLAAEKISQNRAAKDLGQTRTHIGNIVKGINHPGRSLVERIVEWSGGQVTAKELRPDWAKVMNQEAP